MRTKIKRKSVKMIRKIRAKTSDKRVATRATVLLLLATGKTIAEIASLEMLSESGVKSVKRRYVEGGIDRALFDRSRSGRPPIFSPTDKHRIAAKACTDAPEGRARWTVVLLSEEIEKDSTLPTASRETVRQALHSHQIKPWLQKMWCVPDLNDEYIRRMEDVLDLYERPYDARTPVICVDEKPTQLLGDGRPSIPATLGCPAKKNDYEYKRNGTANVFCGVEPKTGRHFTKVTKRRKKPDFAEFMKDISEAYPKAQKISVVLDNLNTHNESSLIARFGDELGRRIWSRFDVHYTPKHASWLNQAEIAIGIFSRQCLGKDRIPTIEMLESRAAAWNARANKKRIVINWTFTTKKARKKLKYKTLAKDP